MPAAKDARHAAGVRRGQPAAAPTARPCLTLPLCCAAQLWDVGGHVRSLQMAANYLQGSDAVVIVYDVTQHEVRQPAVLGWVEAQQAKGTVREHS